MKHHKDKDTIRRYEYLIETAQENNSMPPSLFEGYPEDFEPYLHWYMEAFMRLSKSRATTMAGAWFIPLSEVLAYARYLRLDEVQTDRFIDYIQVLDEEYVSTVNEDKKDQKKPGEPERPYLNR